jgi:flavin-binding protein dodecin
MVFPRLLRPVKRGTGDEASLRDECDLPAGRAVEGASATVLEDANMTDHTYRIIELAGSSEVSHADAIENAIARASKTMRHLRWFEVTQMRGEIEDGHIQHYQVTMKVGFTLED